MPITHKPSNLRCALGTLIVFTAILLLIGVVLLWSHVCTLLIVQPVPRNLMCLIGGILLGVVSVRYLETPFLTWLNHRVLGFSMDETRHIIATH